jgi:hypothetical protein
MKQVENICELVRKAEDNYLNGTVSLGAYVDWSMHDTVETIDAYLNNKHISGAEDSLGREKPFFNIVNADANIWYRATDIDRKDIRLLPSSIDQTGMAFVATILLHQWMRESRFGQFLNDWGRTLARYGSAIVKLVEKDGKLIPSVVPWNRYIPDPIQFDAIPRIEKFYITPAQLQKNPMYDQEVVKTLIETASSRKTLDGFQKDNKSDFIEIYEVHGELDSRLLEKKPKDTENIEYIQQMHVVSYIQTGKPGEFNDFTLYKGKEKKDPYMITHLIEEDGRTLARGSVENLFEAQWMVNHSVKLQKDTLELASKLIFQTADSSFIGRNVLSAIETGDIFVHKENMPLTRLANDKPDISAFQNYALMWKSLGQEINSTPDAARGVTPPSGTALGTVQIVTAQGLSLFEQMTENKGLYIEDMLREFVIPFLKKQMDNKDEVVAILSSEQIDELDLMYLPAQARKNYNKKTTQKMFESVETLISGGEPEPLDPFNEEQEQAEIKQGMAPLGNKRSFKPDELDQKTWKEALKDFEWEVVVEVTNETSDKQAVLTTLSGILQTIAGNPQMLQDPNARMILNALLTETGRISPLQLVASQAQPAKVSGAPLQEITKANEEVRV